MSWRRSRLPSLAVLVGVLVLAAPAQSAPKVVVLGFDGADAQLTRQYMDEGRLPHLSQLAKEGQYSSLLPTNPPQTPVSWSTFATGLNPGRTEIFDFLRRTPGTYLPSFVAVDETHRSDFLFGENNGLAFAGIAASIGLVPLLFLLALRSRLGGGAKRKLALLGGGLLVGGAAAGWLVGSSLLPATVPDPLNNRRGQTFWEMAVESGMKARIVRLPLTFPAQEMEGLEMIGGLGVPDLRGVMSQPTIYTSRAGLDGGQFAIPVMKLEGDPSQPFETSIEGPRNLLFPEEASSSGEAAPRLSTALSLRALGGGVIEVNAGGTTSTVKPGEFSDWHEVKFAFNALFKAHGLVRFYNQSGTGPNDRIELVMSPVNVDPRKLSGLRWAAPASFGRGLGKRLGPFKTQGWAIDTFSVSEGLADEQHSLADALDTIDGFEALMVETLTDSDVDVFVQVFAFTDRLQHVFLRLQDPTHPGYDAEKARRYENVVREAYEKMDELVGKARELAPKDTTFLVISDHGFSQFKRGVNINRWLVNHGYLVLDPDPCLGAGGDGRTLDDLFERDRSELFANVDWTRTRAYALGLGNVYVNLAGREPQGTVRPGRPYRELVAELKTKLEALVDDQTGQRPVSAVHHRDEIYRDYDGAVIPDLRVANNPGYRVSWDTSLGGAPCQEVEDNVKAWGADHCSLDPQHVKGILFSNRPLTPGEEPQMADLFPTILTALEIELPPDLDGRSLL
ncbi:MAG: alkaline phosphatase family protein [Acidobacteriota bacterium]